LPGYGKVTVLNELQRTRTDITLSDLDNAQVFEPLWHMRALDEYLNVVLSTGNMALRLDKINVLFDPIFSDIESDEISVSALNLVA
jgi:transcriptional antiterminator Rof (Rho-off)